MDRDTLRVVAVAVLAILALSAAAATLDSATTTGGGMGPSDSGGSGLDDDRGDAPLPREDDDGSLLSGEGGWAFGCNETLREPTTVLALLAALGAVALVIRRRHDGMLAVAFLLAIGLPGAVFYMLFAACSPSQAQDGSPLPESGDLPEGGGMLGDAVGRMVPSTPSLLLLALLAGAFLLAAAVIVRGTDDEEVRPDPEAPADPDDRAAAVASAAGRAADRIEDDGDLENEIYRAWREMVGLLDVSNPRATTPGEFAETAERAGIARADANELTELFEAVRYGGFEATDERERRAVDALRRIEAEYEEGPT